MKLKAFKITIKDSFIMIIGILIGLGLSLLGCSNIKEIIKNIPEDSIVEEITEKVVEDYLEMPEGSLDLTPSSPEN